MKTLRSFTVGALLLTLYATSSAQAAAPATLPGGAFAQNYSFSIRTFFPGMNKATYSGKALPFGLRLSKLGLISGMAATTGTSNFQVCAKQAKKNVCKIFSLSIVGSKYAGTYSGALNFKSQATQLGVPDPNKWQPGTINLSVTLKDKIFSNGIYAMTATNAVVSDPSFGTGTNGVMPNAATSLIQLPANPDPTKDAGYFVLNFPNGTSINLTLVIGLIAAADGSTLSAPAWPHQQQSLSWSATTTQPPLGGQLQAVSFDSWQLTKSAN